MVSPPASRQRTWQANNIVGLVDGTGIGIERARYSEGESKFFIT
jgi:hypothetical protein